MPDDRASRLWVLWLLFFLQFAAIGAYFTFLNIYYREAGMSGAQIGWLNMTRSLVGMAGAVGWGYLSDRSGRPRWLIAAGAAGELLVAQAVPFVHTFAAFLALTIVGGLLGSAAITLVDSTTLVLLGERREEYGRYRLGGTIGYILTSATVGFLYDGLGLRLMFPAYGLIMGAFVASALLLPAIPVQRGPDSPRQIGAMVRRPAWGLFIAVVFLCWIASFASIMFLGVSLDAMGAGQGLIGMAVTIGAVVELPLMATSGRLLRRFGPVRLMGLAMLLMVSRYFLLGWMPTPQWAIAINILNGMAFPLFWTSSVTYANRMAPTGLAGTAQGMLNFASGFAGVISALLTGWLFDTLGPRGIFIVMGFIVLFALALWSVGQFWAQRALAQKLRAQP